MTADLIVVVGIAFLVHGALWPVGAGTPLPPAGPQPALPDPTEKVDGPAVPGNGGETLMREIQRDGRDDGNPVRGTALLLVAAVPLWVVGLAIWAAIATPTWQDIAALCIAVAAIAVTGWLGLTYRAWLYRGCPPLRRKGTWRDGAR